MKKVQSDRARLEADWVKRTAAVSVIANRLLQEQPQLGATAFVVAGDLYMRRMAEKRLNVTYGPLQAAVHIGSYARLEFLIDWFLKDRTKFPTRWLVDDFPREYSSADSYWRGEAFAEKLRRLWEEAWLQNGAYPILVGMQILPVTDLHRPIQIFRGQDHPGVLSAVSWTTDKMIANRFASGAALRRGDLFGHLYEAAVLPGYVYAFVGARGESEVIVDPKYLIAPCEISQL